MAISGKERSVLTNEMEQLIKLGTAEEMINQLKEELRHYNNMLNMANRKILDNHEYEYKIEALLIYEQLTVGLGWWARTKRRVELIKEYRSQS